jgi:hypothetical protein
VGSAGTNSFTDYPGSSGGRPNANGGGGRGGGSGKSDKCDISVEDLQLEEIALSDYYTKNKEPPPEKTKVRVREKLVDGRVAVETDGGEVIGYVPTAYNYLRQCISQGWKYRGKVSSSSTGKLPKLKVDLAGSK